jgi:hypothetical protein
MDFMFIATIIVCRFGPHHTIKVKDLRGYANETDKINVHVTLDVLRRENCF